MMLSDYMLYYYNFEPSEYETKNFLPECLV